MSDKNGSFKKLIRNIRTKKYEKIRFVRNNALVSQRKEGEGGGDKSTSNSNIR